VASGAANVPMIVRVLSVPRMPGVQTLPRHMLELAAEATEAARSLPAAVELSEIPPRNRR
jgi:hypothetical protein